MEQLTDQSKSLIMVKVDGITENPFQPRKVFNEDEILELSESIKTHGMIQPVILRNIGERYQIVAGERRIRAARKAGFAEVPAIIVKLDGIDVAEVSLIENIQRKNLNCMEEADAFFILKSKFGMTAEDIAKRIGKSRPYVSNMLRMLSLPARIKDALGRGDISMGHGRALLSISEQELQIELLEAILRDSMSVRQTENMVAKLLGGDQADKKKKKKKNIADSLAEDSMEHYTALLEVVREIKQSGGRAEVIERETDDFFEVVIRLSK
jgi:ParB family chromosome partitioning protein